MSENTIDKRGIIFLVALGLGILFAVLCIFFSSGIYSPINILDFFTKSTGQGGITSLEIFQMILFFLSFFFIQGIILYFLYLFLEKGLFAIWRFTIPAKLLWGIGSLKQYVKNCWPQYVIIFIISSIILAIFTYGDELVKRIYNASGHYQDPLTAIYSSFGLIILLFIAILGIFVFYFYAKEIIQSINISEATPGNNSPVKFSTLLLVLPILLIFLICDVYLIKNMIIALILAIIGFCVFYIYVKEIIKSITSDDILPYCKYIQNINSLLLLSPVLFILLICIIDFYQVVTIFTTIFAQISAISRFVTNQIEAIILVMILIIIIQWVNNRRYITQIDEFFVIIDDKKQDFCDIDEGVKNEIGRIKKLYLDIGAFRDIESIAHGDFRMFQMTEDPIVGSLSSITGTVKLGSILSIPISFLTTLTNSVICAPRITGAFTSQGGLWQMYASYQDRWKSYAWRVTDDDVKRITDVCTQNQPVSPINTPGESSTEQSTGNLSFTLFHNNSPISLELPITFQVKKEKDSTDDTVQPAGSISVPQKQEQPSAAKSEVKESKLVDHAKIVEVLTAKILIDLCEPGTPRWEAYIFYNRGLKLYRQALREGNDKNKKNIHLKEAFCNFTKAVIFDESYAFAYYGMGLIFSEYSSDTFAPLISYLFDRSVSIDPGFWQAKYAKIIVDTKKHLHKSTQELESLKNEELINNFKAFKEFFNTETTDSETQNNDTLSTIFDDFIKEFGKIIQSSCKQKTDECLKSKRCLIQNSREYFCPLKLFFEDLQVFTELHSIIKNCDELIEKIPDYPAFYYWRGVVQCKMFLNNTDNKDLIIKSMKSFQKALNLYQSQYIYLGMSEDLYLNLPEYDLMYRCYIQNIYLHLSVCEYVHTTNEIILQEEISHIKDIEKCPSYMNAGLITPEFSRYELRSKLDGILCKFSK